MSSLSVRQVAACFSLLLLSLSSSSAGERELTNLGIVNVTQGTEPAISKRLFELLTADVEFVLKQSEKYGFLWSPGVKLTKATVPKGTFKPMIVSSGPKAVADIIEKHKIYDGLIVYQYDAAQKKARFKLFDDRGEERILIKLRLEPDGPMKGSILRHTRRAAIVAIGGAIKFVP